MSHLFLYLNILLCFTNLCEGLEEFRDFFFEFVQDSEFQEDHVLFPFVARGSDFIKPVVIARDDWNHRINYPSEEYSINYKFLSRNCVSCCVIKNGSTSPLYELIFRKIDQQWYLTGFMDLSKWHADE